MSNDKKRRSTYTMPAALADEVESLATQTGVSQQDLLTQGLVRLVIEWRTKGSVNLLPLAAMPAQS